MDPSLIPANEIERLAAVHRYDVLDTPPDGSFDRITKLAADLFSAPISIVSLVDHDRIWFKAHHGLDVAQIDREPGLCASAILQSAPWLLEDARADPRSLANPLVAGDFGLRFYLGIPLRTHDGFNLGTLCVIDRQARTVSQQQIDQLTHLASLVMDQMELRLSARRAVGELTGAVEAKDEALRRQALLAKEIDHRVKNSFALIASLLALQSRDVGPDAAEQINHAARRVASLARAHEHIYTADDAQFVNVRDYLVRLALDLSSMLPGADPSRITVDAVDIELTSDRIVAMGLVVNELVTNAAKQGATQVTIRLHYDGSDQVLTVSNNGPPLPPAFSIHESKGLGLKIVSTLTRQFGIETTCANLTHGAGVAFVLRAPASSL